MDWREFQRSLMKQLPFIGSRPNAARGIENLVYETVKQFMPKSLPIPTGLQGMQGLQPFLAQSLDYDLFETHRSVFVRCRLPGNAESVRFLANRRTLRVEYGESTEEIRLPCDVNSSRTIARYEDGVWEIRMPKWGGSEPLREVTVRDGGK